MLREIIAPFEDCSNRRGSLIFIVRISIRRLYKRRLMVIIFLYVRMSYQNVRIDDTYHKYVGILNLFNVSSSI